MYAPREGPGRGRARILYWFRTPPNVRVGRAPLDEDAIRSLEAAHPDVAFDWTRILKAAEWAARQQGATRTRSAPGRGQGATRAAAQPQTAEPRAAGGGRASEQAVEALEPGIDEARPMSHVEARLGREGLARLRGLYAELMARVTERVSDPVRLERLRAEVERLNPDTWVSDEEARRGIEGFDAAYRAIRAELGLKRRRRGRRRARAAKMEAGPHRTSGGAAGGGAPPEGSAV
jgi:hypothetical protein